jgi:hypothetical protein
MNGTTFADDFDGPELDRDVWVPHYLPQWSSRADSAAVYALGDSALTLRIPLDLGLWCAGDHQPPLRVSGIQSGVFSGEVGSTVGQGPYREGLVVREHQPAFWGWTPRNGRVEVRARMDLTPRSMASVWLIGLHDEPGHAGEITVFEVFGDAVDAGASAEVGVGVKPLRDPLLRGGFSAPRLPIDVAEFHVYAAEWRPGRVEAFVDDQRVTTVDQAPDYPMQAEVAVFDFPAHEQAGAFEGHEPSLVIDWIRGRPLQPIRGGPQQAVDATQAGG